MPDASRSHPHTSGWVRLSVVLGEHQVDLVSGVLWAAGTAGIEQQDQGDQVRLLAGFERPAAAEAARQQLAAAGHPDATIEPVVDDGLDAWRAWAEPVSAGGFVLTPTWLPEPAPEPGETVLWLDPGHTFGSGSHPTTRLVLAVLDGVVTAGARMLDVGCGSGVLAVGAALRGAHVDAIDIDPESPTVTTANAARNGVADRVRASGDPLAQVVARGHRYDVVAANLLAPVIAELAEDLVAAVAPGGLLVASGLLADRWEASAAVLAPLEVHEVHESEGWVAVVLGTDAPGER